MQRKGRKDWRSWPQWGQTAGPMWSHWCSRAPLEAAVEEAVSARGRETGKVLGTLRTSGHFFLRLYFILKYLPLSGFLFLQLVILWLRWAYPSTGVNVHSWPSLPRSPHQPGTWEVSWWKSTLGTGPGLAHPLTLEYSFVLIKKLEGNWEKYFSV